MLNLDQLNDSLKEIWDTLIAHTQAALHEPHHPFRSMCLGTVSHKVNLESKQVHSQAETRIVIVRDFDVEHLKIRFYTDIRSSKNKQLLHCPHVTACRHFRARVSTHDTRRPKGAPLSSDPAACRCRTSYTTALHQHPTPAPVHAVRTEPATHTNYPRTRSCTRSQPPQTAMMEECSNCHTQSPSAQPTAKHCSVTATQPCILGSTCIADQ